MLRASETQLSLNSTHPQLLPCSPSFPPYCHSLQSQSLPPCTPWTISELRAQHNTASHTPASAYGRGHSTKPISDSFSLPAPDGLSYWPFSLRPSPFYFLHSKHTHLSNLHNFLSSLSQTFLSEKHFSSSLPAYPWLPSSALLAHPTHSASWTTCPQG